MNKKYIEFLSKVKEYGTIIIHRHSRPDGDAIGSQIGLRESLKSSFPYKKIYCVGDMTDKFNFLGSMDNIDDCLYKQALVIILDSGDESLVSDSRYKNARYKIRIDHHISKGGWVDLDIVDSDSVSCASIVTKMILDLKLKLNKLGAQALFTGIVTDSGRFRYEGTTSETFILASELIKYNFSTDDIYNNLYNEDIRIVKLRAQMSLKFQLTEKGVAYLVNTQKEMKEYNTDLFMISRGMVNVMSGIKGIDVWANFTEDEDGSVVVEIRSSKYNVNPVAVKYGGGGHAKASGATIPNLDCIGKVLRDLDNLLEE